MGENEPRNTRYNKNDTWYKIIVMLKTKLLISLVGSLFIFSPALVLAQQNVQSSGSLQNQSTAGQSTGTLQTQADASQNSSSSVLETGKKKSLSVVGSPNQKTPSVTVGPSTSKTFVNSTAPSKSKVMFIVLTIIFFVIFFYVFLKILNRVPSLKTAENVTAEAVAITAGAKEKPKKTAKKATTAKKKKNKKRTHR